MSGRVSGEAGKMFEKRDYGEEAEDDHEYRLVLTAYRRGGSERIFEADMDADRVVIRQTEEKDKQLLVAIGYQGKRLDAYVDGGALIPLTVLDTATGLGCGDKWSRVVPKEDEDGE